MCNMLKINVTLALCISTARLINPNLVVAGGILR